MRTAAIGLAIGAVLGVLVSVVWLKVEAAATRRRAARRQAEWDAHIADVVRLSETPLFERVRLEVDR